MTSASVARHPDHARPEVRRGVEGLAELSAPAPGRSRAASVPHGKSVLYVAFVWARSTLNGSKQRFPARAVGPHGQVGDTLKHYGINVSLELGRIVALY